MIKRRLLVHVEITLIHLNPTTGYKALGSHMLEICPSIADGKAKIEVHPLGIGGKDAPAVWYLILKQALHTCTSLIDMGTRFRMVVHDVECVEPEAKLEKLPVASALWTPMPDLKTGAACMDLRRRSAPQCIQPGSNC